MNPEPHDTAPLDSEAEKMREADSSIASEWVPQTYPAAGLYRPD